MFIYVDIYIGSIFLDRDGNLIQFLHLFIFLFKKSLNFFFTLYFVSLKQLLIENHVHSHITPSCHRDPVTITCLLLFSYGCHTFDSPLSCVPVPTPSCLIFYLRSIPCTPFPRLPRPPLLLARFHHTGIRSMKTAEASAAGTFDRAMPVELFCACLFCCWSCCCCCCCSCITTAATTTFSGGCSRRRRR